MKGGDDPAEWEFEYTATSGKFVAVFESDLNNPVPKKGFDLMYAGMYGASAGRMGGFCSGDWPCVEGECDGGQCKTSSGCDGLRLFGIFDSPIDLRTGRCRRRCRRRSLPRLRTDLRTAPRPAPPPPRRSSPPPSCSRNPLSTALELSTFTPPTHASKSPSESPSPFFPAALSSSSEGGRGFGSDA